MIEGKIKMGRKCEAYWNDKQHRWQCNVQMNGIRRTFVSSAANSKSTCKKGKIEAEKKADKWLDSQLVNENTRLEAMADLWKISIKERCGKEYCEQYERYMRLYIKPIIGKKRIGQVNEGDLQAVIDKAYALHNLSEKTLKNLAGCMMAFIKYCRINKATSLVVESHLLIPKQAKKSEKTILDEASLKILFTDNTTNLYDKTIEDPYIWLYRWMVTYGLRPGENCALMKTDITGSTFKVKRALNRNNEITGGKNDNARRIEVINKTAQWILNGQQAMLAEQGIKSNYVFPDIRDGSIVTQRTVRTYWHRYCEFHGITCATTPYELRHTFCSINDTMPDYLKKQVMGHSKNMDTDGIYGHKKKGDMEKIGDYIDGTMSQFVASK